MFNNNVLADQGMITDPANDGRHKLADKPHARESIPYIVVLPEHQIAFFTYTWVSKDSQAGAALAVFGPGVGPEPIQQRLADRPVPADMNFDNWTIEGFQMKQDLKFDRAHVRWATPEATVEFDYEAFHPPYAYGSDPRGCPPYCADDRIEQAGRVKGTLTLGDKVINFDATGHRDHSWGTRDWIAFQQYEWFVGQVGDEISVHFWHLHALGQTELRGYVFKDGLMANVTAVDVKVVYDDAFWQKSYTATVIDTAGRTTTVSTDVFGAYTLVPHPDLALRESGGRSIIDGKVGVGWMECAWPTSYLNHIVANAPY